MPDGTITTSQVDAFHAEVERLAEESASGIMGWLLNNGVPQHGRYSGNGANDAWVIWQAYTNVFGNGTQISRNEHGVEQVRDLLADYQAAHPNDPLGILPLSHDVNSFIHDLMSFDGLASDVWNNITFGWAEFTAWLSGADLFHAVSGAFINIFGNASALVSAAVNVVGSAVSFSWDAMNDFAGALGDAFDSMTSFDFGGAVQDLLDGIDGIFRRFLDFLGEVMETMTPVVLDLDGDGVELVGVGVSSAIVDFDGDGVMDRSGWVSPDDGILAIDANGNGVVDGVREFSFADPANGYDTDLEGLARYDSNGDGVLDAADERFNDFVVWRDLNGNGLSDPGEVQSVHEAGLVSIALALNGDAHTVADNFVYNSTIWVDANGVVHEALDVGFRAGVHEAETEDFDWGRVTGGADGVQVDAYGPIDISQLLEEFAQLWAGGQIGAVRSGDLIFDHA